jgi:hypothetical protein
MRIAGSLDQTLEVGRRRDRNEVLPGSQAGNAVFAKIVRPLRSNLLPTAPSRHKSLAMNRNLSLRHGIAIFIRHASFNHGCSLQANG